MGQDSVLPQLAWALLTMMGVLLLSEQKERGSGFGKSGGEVGAGNGRRRGRRNCCQHVQTNK